MTGEGPSLKLDEQATLTSDTISLLSMEASLTLAQDVAPLDGPQVHLFDDLTPRSRPRISKTETPETKKLAIRLCDPQMKPYKAKTYTLATQGFHCRDTTDGEGFCQEGHPQGCVRRSPHGLDRRLSHRRRDAHRGVPARHRAGHDDVRRASRDSRALGTTQARTRA